MLLGCCHISLTNIVGMGKGIAEALVAGGAETYALSRTQEDLAKLKDEVCYCYSFGICLLLGKLST